MSENLQEPVKRGRQTRGPLTPALRVMVPAVRSLSRLVFKEKFEGQENIPATGPALVVLNHVSVLDPLATAAFLWTSGRLPLFMIKDSVFKVPVVGKLMTGSKQIPVSRGSAAAQRSLDDAVAALRAGGVVAVYPEGTVTRDPDFWPMQAKTGVARIALAVPEAKVIPVAQWGAHRAYDYHTKKMRLFPRKQTHIRAMPAMDTSAYAGRTDNEAARRLTDDMMHALAEEVGRMRGKPAPKELYRFSRVKRAQHDGDVTDAP